MLQDLEAQSSGRPYLPEDDQMLMAEEVSVMLRLKELGWGVKRIARELGISKNTARRYLKAGGTPHTGSRREPRRSTGSRSGSRRNSSSMPATPTWCVSSSRRSTGFA
jgi:hypothetical protein